MEIAVDKDEDIHDDVPIQQTRHCTLKTRLIHENIVGSDKTRRFARPSGQLVQSSSERGAKQAASKSPRPTIVTWLLNDSNHVFNKYTY